MKILSLLVHVYKYVVRTHKPNDQYALRELTRNQSILVGNSLGNRYTSNTDYIVTFSLYFYRSIILSSGSRGPPIFFSYIFYSCVIMFRPTTVVLNAASHVIVVIALDITLL